MLKDYFGEETLENWEKRNVDSRTIQKIEEIISLNKDIFDDLTESGNTVIQALKHLGIPYLRVEGQSSELVALLISGEKLLWGMM